MDWNIRQNLYIYIYTCVVLSRLNPYALNLDCGLGYKPMYKYTWYQNVTMDATYIQAITSLPISLSSTQ